MRIIIFGPPGVGKGTVAGWILNKYSIVHISTGDILREAIKKGTELGEKAKPYMNFGMLVPDNIIIDLIKKRLTNPDCKKGYILDGYPRTIPQAKFLDKELADTGLNIDHVLNLKAPMKVIIQRLSGRRMCSHCRAIFHLTNIPPKVDGVCDKCKGELYQREDDKPRAIKKRLKVYLKQTKPLLKFYKRKKIIRDVDTHKPLDEIFKNVAEIIE